MNKCPSLPQYWFHIYPSALSTDEYNALYDLIQQARTTAIDECIDALPKYMGHDTGDGYSDGFNYNIDATKEALLALKK